MSEWDDATLAAEDVITARLRVGDTFARRYRVEREVGRGGMGAVYVVRDEELGESVALKILAGEVADNDVAVERFRREVRLARRVTHRNVARTFDIGESEGILYLTMEFIAGRSLAADLADAQQLAPSRALDVATQIAEGLSAAHAAGVIHRDLKPANVMLADDGRVVVTDFGIARSTIEEPAVTREGAAILGTPTYMAPEQVTGAPVTERTDVYALGLILYEMLTGRRPFARDTAIATAVARLQEQPEPPTRYVSVSAEVEVLVLRCLALEVDDRPQSAADVAAALRDLVVPSTGSPSTAADTRVPCDRAVTTASFVSATVRGRGLAILPFSYRGPADESYLAESMTDELIDVLSMTRGLRIPASGATARFAENRDPKTVGTELAVDAVVDGTLQRAGSRVRVSARLIDAASGIQTWTERFDGDLEDVFELQDRLARRVAESLRVELSASVRGRISGEAAELYWRARRQLREYYMGGADEEGAPALFERCLALAPDFAPAVAGLAHAYARMWFLSPPGRNIDWEAKCRGAVAHALELAPELPETHVAAARMHLQELHFPASAKALARALHLAPTCAVAHSYLGILQLEAGRAEEGRRHVELACELDPSDRQALVVLARSEALFGRWDEVDRLFDVIQRDLPYARRIGFVMRMRLNAWRRETVEVEAAASMFSRVFDPEAVFFTTLADAFLDQVPPEALQERLAGIAAIANRRLRAMLHQLATEAFGINGHVDAAVEQLEQALHAGLVDLDWLQRCPCLEGVREHAAYPAALAEVRSRVNEIWSVT